MACEPVPYGLRLVGSVVVHHNVDIEFLGDIGIDGTKEFDELLGTMAAMDLADHLASRNVEGSEQRRRPVTLVVVRTTLRYTRCQWQDGLGTIQGLNLTLLIDAPPDVLVLRSVSCCSPSGRPYDLRPALFVGRRFPATKRHPAMIGGHFMGDLNWYDSGP